MRKTQKGEICIEHFFLFQTFSGNCFIDEDLSEVVGMVLGANCMNDFRSELCPKYSQALVLVNVVGLSAGMNALRSVGYPRYGRLKCIWFFYTP